MYIDGPVHDEPAEQVTDASVTQRLKDAGYLVLRFHHAADWNEIFDHYQDLFGTREGV